MLRISGGILSLLQCMLAPTLALPTTTHPVSCQHARATARTGLQVPEPPAPCHPSADARSAQAVDSPAESGRAVCPSSQTTSCGDQPSNGLESFTTPSLQQLSSEMTLSDTAVALHWTAGCNLDPLRLTAGPCVTQCISEVHVSDHRHSLFNAQRWSADP